MTKDEIITIWKHVLNLETIDPDKTFFEHGGNSLQAMTVLQLAEEEYNYSVDLMHFFEHGTITSMLAGGSDDQ